MMKALLLFKLICISSYFLAQSPSLQWQKSLGGTSGEWAKSVQQTSDGGYIIAGYSYSNNGDIIGHHGATSNSDCWIVRLDANGAFQWEKSLGGSGNEEINAIEQTSDGGFIIACAATSTNGDITGNHGNYDCWVVKLDGNGTLQWENSLGGINEDSGSSIHQTTDGGYIVAGTSSSIDGDVTGNHGNNDYWIIKLNVNGVIQWQKSFGGSDDDIAYSIQQTVDNGYVVTGYSKSIDGDVTGNHGNHDYWIVKLDINGALQWQKSLGGNNLDYAYDIKQTLDGGYIITGHTSSTDGDITGHHGVDYNSDCWVVKIDGNGFVQWEKSIGGSESDVGYGIQLTSDGGYILTGSSSSSDGDLTGVISPDINSDLWILKLNNMGIIQWQKLLGGSNIDYGYCVQKTSDNGYIIAGTSWSNDGEVTGNHGNADFWVVKLTPDNITAIKYLNDLESKISVYPNPSSSLITIDINKVSLQSLCITNSLGQVIIHNTQQIQTIDLSNQAKGIYFLNISTYEGLIVKKIFIE